MTYCIAWKSLDSIYLISDSARTVVDKTYESEKSESSMGERSISKNDVHVEEWLHKQFRIGNELIISYAGDVDIAIEIISTTKKYYDNEDPLKSFELALDARRDFDGRPKEVVFLIGVKIHNEISLLVYNYKNSQIIEWVKENEIIQIGSLATTDYKELTAEMFHRHIKKLDNPNLQFYQFLSFLQHYGLHDDTLKRGAGGLYTGIFLNKDGAHWGEDTSIIIYERNIKSSSVNILGRINHFVRCDSLVSYSSFTGLKEMFVSSKDSILFKSLKLQNEIGREHENFSPKIFFFLAKDEKILVTIKTNGINSNIHFMDRNDEDTLITTLSTDFVKLLKCEIFDPRNRFYIYWNEIYQNS